jgi:Putative phage serine protease XkdF
MTVLSQSKFVIKDDAQRFVMGEVYFPSQEDSQGEFMLPETVRKIAHDFLMAGRVAAIDRNHDFQDSGNLIAESFVVRGKNDPDGFAEGAWVVGAYILNDADWHKVQKGEHNGWSWAGPCSVVPSLVEVDHAILMAGKTEAWPDFPNQETPHTHELRVLFDDAGRVIPTNTGPAIHEDGQPDTHVHTITRTTATAEALGHSHRIIIDGRELS